MTDYTKMFIPTKLRVRFQDRKDTYTGKLAYVIYYDEKNKLRKEQSWESWRSKKIDPQEFENEPTSGFVLNKGVGGVSYSSWNSRNEYIRVFDPRGFEFEISVANLLFILQECTSTKGKGLEGEFVYAWYQSEFVLLPVSSKDYEHCVVHTARQSKRISAKDIKVGHSYVLKNGKQVLYLGKHPYNNVAYYEQAVYKHIANKHVFLWLKETELNSNDDSYITYVDTSSVSEQISDTILDQYRDELEKFFQSKYYGDIGATVINEVNVDFLTDSHNYGLYLIKDGEQYRAIRYSKRHFYYQNHYLEYNVMSTKPFDIALQKNNIKIPHFEFESQKTRAQMQEIKFYSLTLVTTKGKTLKVI